MNIDFAPSQTDRQRGSMQVTAALPGMALCATRKPTMVDAALIRACKSRLDAIILCMQLSRKSYGQIAKALGLDKGHLTRILQGLAYFPDQKSIDLMTYCGNYAPMQYEAYACGFELYENPRAKRKAELEAELMEITRQEIGGLQAAA